LGVVCGFSGLIAFNSENILLFSAGQANPFAANPTNGPVEEFGGGKYQTQ